MEENDFLYAVGQGALAIECRIDNESILNLLEPLYDLQTAIRVTAERSFLKKLGGGCSAPVAVSSQLKVVKERQFELVLTGAVWSLDGSEECIHTKNVYIKVDKDLRCDTCPHKSKSTVIDIENIQCAGKCMVDIAEGPLSKRAKFDNIPVNILKSDPHDHSPVKIPIGADFMGKCPYLESHIEQFKNSNGTSEQLQPDYQKCPFLFENILSTNTDDLTLELEDPEHTQDNLFCGLVLHREASRCGMEQAKNLGIDMAQNLISKGALDIMFKAQNIIHSQTVKN